MAAHCATALQKRRDSLSRLNLLDLDLNPGSSLAS
jgi:hypothetical protein